MPILWGYLINWLDQMMRYNEAIEAVVKMLGKGETAKEAGERNRLGHQWRRAFGAERDHLFRLKRFMRSY
jgi:hypothetical protein